MSRAAFMITIEVEGRPRAYFDTLHSGETCRVAAWVAGQRERLIAEIDAALEAAVEQCAELEAS